MLARLGRQSDLERSGKRQIKRGQEMLAITTDTGIFFSILLKAIKAKYILEVGTSVGFSTLWLAEAIGKRGRIVTIETDLKKIKRAKEHFRKAGVEKLIDIRHGTALDILPTMKKHFDFILIDADKENIVQYFDLVLPLVRTGGIIAADNMLFPQAYRRMMQKYSDHVRSKHNVQSVTVPIGMGEEVTIKLYD